jgi:hypothetical protein
LIDRPPRRLEHMPGRASATRAELPAELTQSSP